MKTRICSVCKKELPLTHDYFYRNNREKGGFHYRCKGCKYVSLKRHTTNEQGKAYRRECERRYGRSSVGREKTRQRNLKYRFNLTLEQYDRMFEQQNGVCAICGQADIAGARLAIDHDHETGKIRGLLCTGCNVLLGRFENNPELFRGMVEYMKECDSVGLPIGNGVPLESFR